jgi:hypothetical protein
MNLHLPRCPPHWPPAPKWGELLDEASSGAKFDYFSPCESFVHFKSIGSIWAAEGKRTSDGADCIFRELVMARVENGTQASPGSAKFEFRLAFDAFKPSGKWTELLFHGK